MSNENQHIPSGYKPSPLGIIPEDWEVKRLGEVVTVNSGKDYKHLSTGNIPVYGTGGYMLSVNDRLSDIDAVGIGRKGTIDKPQYLRAPFWTVDTLFFLTTKENYDLRFVFNLSQLVEWKKYSEQTGVPSLTSKSINNIQIAVPPLPEQQRIVSVLSLWDTAIAKQTALIEKLTLRKRGLMQQLLTGKKRLKGFEGEWKEVRLGKKCEITTGKLDANAMVNNGTYPFYTCAKEVYRINEYAFDTEALLVSGNGEHVGYVHYYKGKFNAYQRTYVLDKFLENIFYLYYALNQYLPKRILQTKSNSNTPYIVMETLANMGLLLPENNEQKAIAEILMAADKEIEKQKQKLAAMQEQKRGLMQVLLTGKKGII